MTTDVQFDTKPLKPKGMQREEIKKLFTAMTWVPTPEQAETIEGLRKECYKLAGLISVNTQPGAEQTISITRIWEAFEYAKLAVMLNCEVF